MVAAFMSVETKALLIGEAAHPSVQAGLREMISVETGAGKPITRINDIKTMHLGPEDILVVASVDFEDGQTARSVEATNGRIEAAIKARYPAVRQLFLEVKASSEAATVNGEIFLAHRATPVAATRQEARERAGFTAQRADQRPSMGVAVPVGANGKTAPQERTPVPSKMIKPPVTSAAFLADDANPHAPPSKKSKKKGRRGR